jgi:hypothetical protein
VSPFLLRDQEKLELTGVEWDNIGLLVKLLGPISLTTDILGGQKYPTLCHVFPYLKTCHAITVFEYSILINEISYS